MQKSYLIKSALFVPGDRPERVDKALKTNASVVIIDLEDAVGPDQKDKARESTADKIDTHATERIIVRINALDSGLAQKDVMTITRKGLFAIMVPKICLPEDFATVNRLILKAEQENGVDCGSVKVIPLVESALGVENAYAIARTPSDFNRLFTLSFGAADFSHDLGVAMTKEGAERQYPRARIAVACRAAGLEPPLDTPYMVDLNDLEALQADALAAKGLGFGGKLCVHPKQVDVINQVFSPTQDEVNHAKRIIKAFTEAEQKGMGAIQLDGTFIDIAVVKKAKRILAAALPG